MNRSLLWVALAGVAGIALYKLPARVKVSMLLTEVRPEEAMEVVAMVEREPELIPFVRDVRVERREGDTVRYRVEAGLPRLAAWARFQKCIRPDEGRAEWTTLDGALGFDQQGRIYCNHEKGLRLVTVETLTRFHLPFIGPLLAHLSSPVLSYAFLVWLMNLNDAPEKKLIGDLDSSQTGPVYSSAPLTT